MKKRVEEERDQMRKERLSDGERKRKREVEREKKKYISNARATVTVHICMVTIAIMHKCTILHPLM